MREDPSCVAALIGGGGTTLPASEAEPLRSREVTVGGGGTTSEGPKILPIRLPMKVPPLWVGGGGTTVREGSETVPPARRRASAVISAEGGGVSFELREVACSGADTGGAMTDEFVI
jgi:hypothetical protein